MTKVKINAEALETMKILENLKNLYGIIDTNIIYDLEVLAVRLGTKNYDLLANIMVDLDCTIFEE